MGVDGRRWGGWERGGVGGGRVGGKLEAGYNFQ